MPTRSRFRHALAGTALAFLVIAPRAPGQVTPNPRSTAAIKEGRTQWLRYDTEAHQAVTCDSALYPSVDSASTWQPDPQLPPVYLSSKTGMSRLHNVVYECRRLASNTGAGTYARAEVLFREAFTTLPADPRAFRQLAMLLADHNRWKDLESVAQEQITRDPSDPWGHLAIALALYRSGATDRAAAAFDSATARLDPGERARLFSFQRLLSKRDSLTYAKATPAQRAHSEQLFWALADPLWSRKSNDPRTEYLARVVYAELRWTVEEEKVRGADSDRGEMYIRYGPPDGIVAVRGTTFGGTAIGMQSMTSASTQHRMDRNLPQPSDVITYWDYDTGLTLVFWGAPTFGTARLPRSDASRVQEVVEARPAAFDNIVRERIVLMPSQVARFRAPGDSVDVLLIAQAPMPAIRNAFSASTPVRGDFWLLHPDGSVEFRDSLPAMRASGIEQRVFRVAPGSYIYRVEATTEGSTVAGRTTAAVDAGPDSSGFSLRGFGISDLLLAAIARPNAAPPKRWTDFDVAPLFGGLPPRSNLEIIWETYELGVKNAQTAYTVNVSLERQRSAAGRIVASVVGLAAGAVGVDRKDDRVTFKFDRTAAPSPVVVDQVSVAMGDTPVGDYLLTLEITDKASGRKTKRTNVLSIRN